MVNSDKVKEIYDEKAIGYDKSLKKMRYHTSLRNILSDIDFDIGGNGRIFDIGCGTGLVTEIMKERFPDTEIVGFDYSEEMIKIYRKRFPDVKAVIGDFNRRRDLSGLGQFDAVISVGAVSEYGKRREVVRNIYDLVKDGGIFFDIGNRRNAFCLITGYIWHYWPMGRKGLNDECKRAGFSRIEKQMILFRDFPRNLWSYFPSNIIKFAVKAIK